MVGEIRKVEKHGQGVFQYAELAPSVDLTKLEEVLVITGSSLPLREDREKKAKKTRK
jgi:cell shape-determining protein MreC